MKKIPSVFQRNYETDRLVRNEVVPGCEWVLNGEGVATVKFDGTSCLFKDGNWFKRYDAHGKTPPSGFIPAQEPDEKTGHWPGWVPVEKSDKWHCEAIETFSAGVAMQPQSGQTYELCGPKIQGNPEKLPAHWMVKHGAHAISESDLPPPPTFESIREFLAKSRIEGIVFYHPDGRMAKIKRKDFGFKWPEK